MNNIISADYNQTYLLPPRIEDWIPQNHPARFIREFIASADLNAMGFELGNGIEGRPTYGKELLLSIWLYGYFQKIRSCRKLEDACRDNIGFIWLTGMNRPDHNTLWRFFKKNKKALRKLFSQSVQVAFKADLVGLALHALDGTMIAAQVANRTGLYLKTLEKSLSELEEAIKSIEDEIEASNTNTDENTNLPEQLQEKTKLKEAVQQALDELNEKGLKHFHSEEPDARMMSLKEGPKAFGYNAQIVVDEENQLIVAQDVVNDGNDMQQLLPMLENVKEELGSSADETLADAGYATGKSLSEAQEGEHSVIVNLTKALNPDSDEPYRAGHFEYDKEQNCCICPRGEILDYVCTRKNNSRGYILKKFRCKNKTCPVRKWCSPNKHGRVIEINQYYDAVQKQKKKLKEPENQKMLRKRRHIVEPVFGIIKANHGFRRFTLRGIELAKTQWSLICTAYNLRKLYAHWAKGVVKVGQKIRISSLFDTFNLALAI